MFASRFWYLLLTVIGGMGVAAFLLAKNTYNRSREEDARELIFKDKSEVTALLNAEARLMIDHLMTLSLDEDVRKVLDESTNSKEGINNITRDKLRAQLDSKNKELGDLAGDIIIALDGNAKTVSYIWNNENITLKNLTISGLPIVKAALQGYLQDDIVSFQLAPQQFQIYRLAARPVIHNGRYVGALLYGQLISENFAKRISNKLGSQVFLFKDDLVYSGIAPQNKTIVDPSTVAQPINNLLADKNFQEKGLSDLVKLNEGQYIAIYSLFIGEASKQNAGYILLREVPQIISSIDFVNNATKADWKELPWITLTSIFIGVFLLGLIFSYFEHTSPLIKFKKAIARVLARENDRVNIYAVSRQHRKMAEAINKVLDQAIGEIKERLAQQSIDVDSILSPIDSEGRISQALFEKPAELPNQPKSNDIINDIMNDKVKPATEQSLPLPSVPQNPIPAGQTSKPKPPPPPPKPKIDDKKTEEKPATVSDTTQEKQADDKIPTIDTTQPSIAQSVATYNEEEYFKQLFEDFKKLKMDCGETIDNLKFERFVQTLEKNKELIKQKFPNCKRVEFKVYIKEGKASIKASPLL